MVAAQVADNLGYSDWSEGCASTAGVALAPVGLALSAVDSLQVAVAAVELVLD